MRITAACPAALISDANHLAMCLGQSADDARTYAGVSWRDADGNEYAAASWETTPAWVEWALAGIARPAWDVEQVIDMDAAQRAYDALVISETPIPATPATLTARIHDKGVEALESMGLVRIEFEEASA